MSMGRYEIIYILAPNTPDDTMNDLVTRFETEVTTGGGVMLRVEKWGRKKLAYEVRKFREGFFVLFVTDCEGALVTELERRFRMTDQVIKFMSVRVDEELKRAGKMPKDEELGVATETERIDRSRRSGVKPPPPRTETPVDGEKKPVVEGSVVAAAAPEKTDSAEKVEEAASAEATAVESAEEPAAEAAVEPAAEAVEEPAAEAVEEPAAEVVEEPAAETGDESSADTAESVEGEEAGDTVADDDTEGK